MMVEMLVLMFSEVFKQLQSVKLSVAFCWSQYGRNARSYPVCEANNYSPNWYV